MPDLPFTRYPRGGRELLAPVSGGLSKRQYGREVLAWCDYRCAYCGLDMAIYENWRVASVDHVVPENAVARDGYPATWVKNPVNTVAACRPCNDLFNRDRVADPVPPTFEAFLELRDRTFLRRRERVRIAIEAEYAWFEANVRPLRANTGGGSGNP
ncbi:MAG: HNH endonuclease [Candidatus Limnocylindrales bacterium]